MPKSEVFWGFFWAYRRQRRGTRALDVAVPEPKRLGEGGCQSRHGHSAVTSQSQHSRSTVHNTVAVTQSQARHRDRHTVTSPRSQRTVTAHGHSARSQQTVTITASTRPSTRPQHTAEHMVKAHGQSTRSRQTATEHVYSSATPHFERAVGCERSGQCGRPGVADL